ncbi:MAG TPA: hypothetical protein ENI05_09345 [Porticoccus sp.]|nr:hypothetical protein [Porticoccus sp.]
MSLWHKIPNKRKLELAEMYRRGDDLTPYETECGMKAYLITREVKFLVYYQDMFAASGTDDPRFNSRHLFPTPPNAKIYDDQLEIDSDDVIVIGDIEIPDHSRNYLLHVLYLAMAQNIKTLVIAGDFIATDMSALSSWTTTWRTGDLNYEQVIQVMNGILATLAQWFDNIYIISGNHDDRIARATDGHLHLGMFLRSSTVVYSRYAHLWINTSRGDVKISHPKNFSGNPIVLGQKLYNVEPRKAHHIVAHCHRQQAGWSPDGRYEIHGLGMGRDVKRTKYRSQSVTAHNEWDLSFHMILNAYHYPMGIKSVDWDLWLGPFKTSLDKGIAREPICENER